MKPDPISIALETAPDPATEQVTGEDQEEEELVTGEGDLGDTGEEGATGESGPTGEEGPEPKVDPNVTALMHSIAALTAQVNALSISQAQGSIEDEPVVEKPEPFDFSGIVTEELFEEATGDRVKFVSILNQVAAAATAKAIEHTSRSIPIIAASEVSRNMSAMDIVSKFYRENRDLSGFKPTVRAIFDDLVKKNPGLSKEEIFGSRLGPEVRIRLGLKAPAPVAATRRPGMKRPTTAPGTGSRPTRAGKIAPTAAFEKTLKEMGG